MHYRKAKNGFSIVAIIVAAGIMGFLAIVFSEMILNSKKGQQNVENSIDFDVLRSSIALVLSKPSLCSNAFKNSGGTPAQFNHPDTIAPARKLHSLTMGASSIASLGLNMRGGLKISKLELQYISGAASTFQVALIVEATKTSNSFGVMTLSNSANPFRFQINTNGFDEIINCSPPKKFSEECGSAGGGNGILCCQINSMNGVTSCRHSNAISWTSVNSPFPNPAPDGDYSLSLIGMGPTPYLVCRGNRDTGTVECMMSDSVPANPTWAPFASPAFP